jgi:branched-chain amino acid aminotransferase
LLSLNNTYEHGDWQLYISWTAYDIKMKYPYFSLNGEVKPAKEAVVPLDNVEYSYGYGVYEAVRLDKGNLYFAEDHCRRLMHSAQVIELEHTFSTEFVLASINELLAKNQAETCNLKILLIGGRSKETANLYIMCLNPLFPDRKLYQAGAHCITYDYERDFPAAKTLNMLPSYVAYRQAKQAGAYDALLINRSGCVTEGTRTNFFTIKDKIIFSPPASDVLPGVTRDKVLQTARADGFEIVETEIKLSDINQYEGAFLTSTSSKIMPLRSVGEFVWDRTPDNLRGLMKSFDLFLARQIK